MNKIIKIVIVLIMTFALNGCSVLGSYLGEAVDEETGENKYQEKYASDGLDIDLYILQELLLKKEEVEIDDRACKEPGTHQVCTTRKGCWCESNSE